MDSITSTYEKADGNMISIINNKARNIATDLNIQDRVERMTEQQAFITLKDHKDNFENKPTCRLINPGKSEIGRISNNILININTAIRTKTSLNQWKNSLSIIEWFSNIPYKHKHKFIIFDIENFYPSINESLLKNDIAFAKSHCNIIERDIDIIMNANTTTTNHGSRKATKHLMSPWEALTEQKSAN